MLSKAFSPQSADMSDRPPPCGYPAAALWLHFLRVGACGYGGACDYKHIEIDEDANMTSLNNLLNDYEADFANAFGVEVVEVATTSKRVDEDANMTRLNNPLNDYEADLANAFGVEVVEVTTTSKRVKADDSSMRWHHENMAQLCRAIGDDASAFMHQSLSNF